MKRSLLILIFGLAVGAASFSALYFRVTGGSGARHTHETHVADKPALGWLKSEFNLSGECFQEVCRLHENYLPKCAEMCRRIEAKNAEIHALIASTNVMTVELGRAMDEAGRLRVECQKAMLEHFFAVAKAMPPEEGRRYLIKMFESTSVRGHTMSHE